MKYRLIEGVVVCLLVLSLLTATAGILWALDYAILAVYVFAIPFWIGGIICLIRTVFADRFISRIRRVLEGLALFVASLPIVIELPLFVGVLFILIVPFTFILTAIAEMDN